LSSPHPPFFHFSKVKVDGTGVGRVEIYEMYT
jgi:hypothetical protein